MTNVTTDTTIKSGKKESDMPPLEGEEELSEGIELKILTRSKLLTRLPILLPHVKVGNNSYKLKNEIRQNVFCISIIKSLKKFTTTCYK